MKFEYKTILQTAGDPDSILNDLGSDGWKIISVLLIKDDRHPDAIHYVFEKASVCVTMPDVDRAVMENKFKCKSCDKMVNRIWSGLCDDCVPF